LYDGIGQIVGLLDENGELVVKYSYDAWGKPTEYLKNQIGEWEEVAVGSFGNPYLYKNYYYDTETGLYYLNARYYDPSIGRFLSKDPNGAKLISKILNTNNEPLTTGSISCSLTTQQSIC